MAINDYNSLIGAVQDWLLDRTDLVAKIPTFLALLEAKINRKFRIKAMEASLSLTTTASNRFVTLPSDFVELKLAYIISSYIQYLDYVTNDFIYTTYINPTATGIPCFISRERGNFLLGPTPDTQYTINGTYYVYFENLSTDNPTNWLTENAPDLLLYGTLLQASPYLRASDDLPIWQTQYDGIVADLINQEKLEKRSNGRVVARAVR
jgi:hypothetical protein